MVYKDKRNPSNKTVLTIFGIPTNDVGFRSKTFFVKKSANFDIEAIKSFKGALENTLLANCLSYFIVS